MRKTGKSLERLVASLEKALVNNANAIVESPKRLRDITTGRLREHDVIITTTQGHHSVKIAIECRDRSRPITVNQVEGFWAKCQDTGVHQGIIVSSTGFYDTAKKKAEYRGIRCLSIEEVDSFNWLLAPGFQLFNKKILHTNWVFHTGEKSNIDCNHFEVLDVQGNVVTTSILTANAMQQLELLLPNPPVPTPEAEIKVRFEGNGLVLRDKGTGITVPVMFALATIRYAISVELIPFKMIQYVDKDKGSTITDAAVAQLNLGECKGKVMIVYKEDIGGQVIFVPDKCGKTA
jgi:molybdopterin-binding protein